MRCSCRLSSARSRFAAVLLLLVLSPFAIAAQQENTGIGPFELRNQYPLAATRLTGTPWSPEILGQEARELSLGIAWGSTFAQRDPYVVDEERVETRIRFASGVTEQFELGIELPVVWRGGGALDSVIDWWHQTFSLPEGGRDNAPRDQFQIAGFTEEGGVPFSFDERGVEVGNIVLQGTYALTEGDSVWPAVSIRPEVSLPTASREYGHDGLDFGLQTSLAKRIESFVLYGGAGGFFHSEREISGVRYKPFHGEFFAAVEYQMSSNLSVLVSGNWESELISNVVRHPHHSFYLDYGIGWQPTSESEIHIAMRENPSAARGSTDVTFVVELSHRLS